IAQHIDCVVGMSEEIGDTDARAFAAAFYEALAYGRSVRTAFDLGRNRIDLYGLKDEDVPQLLAPNSDPATVSFAKL
ncbi:MAG: CHAT domain-containing protein, partial [Anaerolineae bacterium]|nr:CHAT domain-containing protein [Anaerolineae bacterium]